MEENTELILVLPDFMEDQPDEVKHNWRRWTLINNKIEKDPDRFYTVVNRKTGDSRIYDCRGNVGVQVKSAKQFGADQSDLDAIKFACDKLQKMKLEKADLYRKWSRAVFKTKKGEDGLLNIRSSEILDLFGRFFTVKEVYKIINEKWGTTLTEDALYRFQIKNKLQIDKRKADYVLNAKELRLATDAGRLEVLSMLAYEMESKFEKTKSIEVSKELRSIVEQVRREIKGDEIRLTVDGRIDIQATVQANVTLSELLKTLPINMIVIGLVAAKQKINPVSLIASLGNSYYSKFNGFSKLYDKSEVDLPGKFIRQYNWDEIKSNHEKIKENEIIEDITSYEEVNEATKPVIQSKREELNKLLEQYKKMSK